MKGIFIALILTVSIPVFADTTIVVDTGHTPKQGGATAYNGIKEYIYNLNASKLIADKLRKANYGVIRISADGNEISLKERTEKVPDGAKLFISIHYDSMQQEWIDQGKNKTLSGYSIFVSKKNIDYDKSLMCAKKIAEQLQKIGERPSLYHATPIKGENRPFVDKKLGIHQFDDLIVLKTAKLPAILVEMGVIVNPSEAERLRNKKVIEEQAAAVVRGIKLCIVK